MLHAIETYTHYCDPPLLSQSSSLILARKSSHSSQRHLGTAELLPEGYQLCWLGWVSYGDTHVLS